MYTHVLSTIHKNVYRFDSTVEFYVLQHERDLTQEEFDTIVNKYRHDHKNRLRPLYEVVEDLEQKENFRVSPSARI